MDWEFWHRQEQGAPLYADMLWSRPENRQLAGKLLIAGGNLHGFAAPAEAYTASVQAGIGTARVLLPDAIQKTVGPILEQGEFAPSTPASGSFSQKALDTFLALSAWADNTLVAGDVGRNSETAVLLEKFLAKSPAAVTLAKDAADYAASAPHSVTRRAGTLLVLSLSQLQRLATAARFAEPVRFGMDLLQLTGWLHGFTAQFAPFVITKHLDTMFVAARGEVSTTKLPGPRDIWRVRAAAYASVWWLQNPSRPFEALTTAAYVLADEK